MIGINFRRLARPEVLAEVGKNLLVEFCAHFTSDLAAHSITLPDPLLADEDYYIGTNAAASLAWSASAAATTSSNNSKPPTSCPK